jgi:hypothetical protein
MPVNSSFASQGATPGSGGFFSKLTGGKKLQNPAKSSVTKPMQNTSGVYGEDKVNKVNYAFPQGTSTPTSPFTKPTTGGVFNPSSSPVVNNPAQYSPQSYASQQQGLVNKMGDLSTSYAPRVASAYAQPGIGEGQKRLSDYELARYNTLQTGLSSQSDAVKGLLDKSLPQAIAPGSSVINPIAGTQLSGYSPEQSAFRGGQIAQIATQGGQSVQLNQAQNTISGVKALLGNDNDLAITKLQGFINEIRNNVSSPTRAQFEATLGSLAAQVSPFNPSLAEKLTGEGLKNSSGEAILSAINQAQQAIQAQQQAINGGAQQASGSTGGGFTETW